MEIETVEYYVIYCRVSSKIQEVNSSLSFQTQTIKELLASEKYNKEAKLITIYDIGSARNFENQQMLNEVLSTFLEMRKQGDSQTKVSIFVYHSSRFSRDPIKGLEFLKKMENNNISLTSATEPLLNSLESWEKAIIKAREESDLISERVKSAFKEKTRLGGEYERVGIKSGIFERIWVELEGSLKIPKHILTEKGKRIAKLVQKFTTKRHQDAASKFLFELSEFVNEDDLEDWNIPEVNSKLSEKQVLSLLKKWDPKTNWSLNLLHAMLTKIDTK